MFFLPLSTPQLSAADFDFNCEAECGQYDEDDLLGKSLHQLCTSMEKSEKCQAKFVEEKDSSGQKMDETSRIVGGHPARKPMPWMVLIFSKKYDWKCGGSLVCINQNNYFVKKNTKCFQINNQFVVTAAHCFCTSEMCQRGFEEVSSRPNTIKVRLIGEKEITILKIIIFTEGRQQIRNGFRRDDQGRNGSEGNDLSTLE